MTTFYVVLFTLSFTALTVLAVWVVTAVRTAVRQITENTRRPVPPVTTSWVNDPDAPVPFVVTGRVPGVNRVSAELAALDAEAGTYTVPEYVDPSHTPAGNAPDGLGAPDDDYGPVDEPLHGARADAVRDELRRKCY